MRIAILVAEPGFYCGDLRKKLESYSEDKALLVYQAKKLASDSGFERSLGVELGQLKQSLTGFLSVHARPSLTDADEQEFAVKRHERALRNTDQAAGRLLGDRGIDYLSVEVAESNPTTLHERIIRRIVAFEPERPRGRRTGVDSPDFRPITTDQKFVDQLRQRWVECETCLDTGSPLAAVILMGSLLEGVLWLRATQADQEVLHSAGELPQENSCPTGLLRTSLRSPTN